MESSDVVTVGSSDLSFLPFFAKSAGFDPLLRLSNVPSNSGCAVCFCDFGSESAENLLCSLLSNAIITKGYSGQGVNVLCDRRAPPESACRGNSPQPLRLPYIRIYLQPVTWKQRAPPCRRPEEHTRNAHEQR